MKKSEHVMPATQGQSGPKDLLPWVARYRARLMAEGRLNAVRTLDKAIARLDEASGCDGVKRQ